MFENVYILNQPGKHLRISDMSHTDFFGKYNLPSAIKAVRSIRPQLTVKEYRNAQESIYKEHETAH